MVKFSIPYNGDLGVTKEIIRRYSARIEEIYFPIDITIATTSKGDASAMPMDEVKKLINILNQNKVKSNLLINGVYEGNRDPEAMKDFIRAIGGVNSITVADLYLLEVFKDFGSKLHVSRLAQLNSVEKIRRILTRYPDLAINVDNDLNRDLAALKNIYHLKDSFPNFKVKLMVNEGCLFHCTGRTRHAWLLCLDDVEKKYMGSYFCCFDHVSQGEIDKEMIKSAFIRPEDLHFYRKNKVVDIFKIAGRQRQGKKLITIVDAYMKESFNGSLVELMGTGVMDNFSSGYFFDIENKKFPKDFIERVLNCDKNCAKCNYCQEVAKKVVVASVFLKNKMAKLVSS